MSENAKQMNIWNITIKYQAYQYGHIDHFSFCESVHPRIQCDAAAVPTKMRTKQNKKQQQSH